MNGFAAVISFKVVRRAFILKFHATSFTLPFSASIGTVYNMVLMYDPATTTNGQLSFWLASYAYAKPAAITFTNTWLGRSITTTASAFNGVIYKLKVFERVSTAAEIIAETGTSDLFISISGTSVSAQYSAPPPTLKLNVPIV